MKHPVAQVDKVIAKILSQGARRIEHLDDDTSLYFALRRNGQTIPFSIPRPLLNGGYLPSHLVHIELVLQDIGIELLPIDTLMH